MIRFNTTAFERFWSKVNKDGPIPEHRPDLGKCWVWTGQLNNMGYGVFKPASYHREIGAHKVSWIFAYGDVPTGLHVLHRCDRGCCIRPEHLRLGNRLSNSRDMAAKFRGNTTKLDIHAVRYIRLCYAHRVHGTVAELSKKYGIHRSEVRRVAKGLIFQDVDVDHNPDNEFIIGSGCERPIAMDGSQIETTSMCTRMDLVGDIYDRLTVKSFLEDVGNSDSKWLCICACGKQAIARTTNLRKGKPISCGCLNDEKRRSKQPPLEERFWLLVDKRGIDECWLWKGTLSNGYGRIKRKGVAMGGHRVSWEIANPNEPRLGPNDFICHKCNQPPCCNPSHLFRANVIINNFDRTIKFASKDWTFNKTENIIREIKGLRANGLRYSEIYKITGVRIICIQAILSGKYQV